MLGAYIHIPFCKRICNYCDFCKINYNKLYTMSYLSSLEKEIKERYKGELLDSIYIGGGTPNSLDYEELKKLFEITKIFNLKDKYEFTIECNIEYIDEDKLTLFKDSRVNRISYGIESFNNDNILFLGRNHDLSLVTKNINLTKKYFNNINIDLIYGVNKNLEILKSDIKEFLKLNIPHISCYSLIIEEHTKFYLNKVKYISEEVDEEMFHYINNTLKKNGYNHYEISNYAKDNYESRHNKIYWLNNSYYGFGLSAVSYIDNYRISNTKNLTKYLNNEYIHESIYEDSNMRKENTLMLGLRLLNGISIEDFNKRFNCDIINIRVIKDLLNDKYLEIENNHLKINYKYIYVSNSIIGKIIGSDLNEESN